MDKEEHAEPKDILVIAHEVLAINMPDQDLIDKLKRQMMDLGIEKAGENEGGNGIGIKEVSQVASDASKVLQEARDLSDKVSKAIEAYGTADENCEEAKKFNNLSKEKAGAANDKITKTTRKIQELKNQLENLTTFVNGEGPVGQKMIQLNRNITEANNKVTNAITDVEDVKIKYDETKDKLDAEKAAGLESEVSEFVDSVNKMRKTQKEASDLEDDVQKLLDNVEKYKKDLETLKSSYETVKDDLDAEKVILIFYIVYCTLYIVQILILETSIGRISQSVVFKPKAKSGKIKKTPPQKMFSQISTTFSCK